MNAKNRRQLKTRNRQWVATLTERLVATDITPNQISLFSVVMAFLAGLCFYGYGHSNGWFYLFLAAAFIQCRLLCNLLDGLVAIEGGKGTKSGELFNDIPDRFADVLILVGAGYAIGTDCGVTLGWIAAMFAVMTAYIRTLGGTLNAPISFAGPMAKQHRMAVLTGASVLTVFESWFLHTHYLLMVALIVIALGSLLTCWNRARAIRDFLENQSD